MYPNILSLIYVLYVLHISCAARVIVKDTGANYVLAQLNIDNLCKEVAPEMAVPAADTQDGRLWITAVYDEIIPIRADGRHTVEARMTPLVGALWQTGIHQEVSPSRASNNRANEPEPTPIAVSFRKTEGIASKLSAVQRAEGPVSTHALGLLFQTAVHEKISDS
ncbi:hypothetical protein EV702DRAFT_1201831 [Suillus placidus]|uniref:Uncharacterized protein n=1 Tax=Suillus placidus TaxID=48579 RepID=A0A9P6ZLV3_9AGAM|nr:hypothetical protein EV702DRAFT_1201831 [Suillus placidus]